MSVCKELGVVKQGSASTAEVDDREWYRDTIWFEFIEAKVRNRQRYKPEVDAVIATMPEDVRAGWAEGCAAYDVALASFAALDALSEYGGTENGVRRRVPGGEKFLACVVTKCDVRPELSDQTRETYVKRFVAHAVNAKKLAVARQCKRHSGNADGSRANEYLTYFGREYVENEPSAEPRCTRKRKLDERPPEPRHELEPEQTAELRDAHARLEAERREQQEWDAARKTNPATVPNPNEPTETARQDRAEDAAFCAQTVFESHGEKHRTKLANERRATTRGDDARHDRERDSNRQAAEFRAATGSGCGMASRVRDRAVEHRRRDTSRLRETVSGNDECRAQAVFLDCDARERKR